MTATEHIHIRLEPEIKKQAQEKAQKDGRTLSNYILHLIKEDIKSK